MKLSRETSIHTVSTFFNELASVLYSIRNIVRFLTQYGAGLLRRHSYKKDKGFPNVLFKIVFHLILQLIQQCIHNCVVFVEYLLFE